MKFLLFLLSCILVLTQIHESKSCFTEEKTALLHIKAFLYNQTDDYGHRHYPIADYPLSSWIHNSSSDCCRWSRVTCNPLSGHVTKLYLQDLRVQAINFNFTIDLSLFQTFKELTSLNLSYGYFDSLIHAEVLANLSHLEVLSMEGNHMYQPLPVQGLCRLKKIRVLDLTYNGFQGPLPKCFGNLTSLQRLDLSGNDLSGEIPTFFIANLASLEYLSLEGNPLEGLFSLSSLANNSHLKVLTLGQDNTMLQVGTEGDGDVSWVPSFQLEVLHLSSCKLNAPKGILPSFLLYQHELQDLDLSNNNLVGQFPSWLLINNTKLKHLQLRDNSFTGSFELRHPHPLNFLDLAYNKIAGKLPQDIGCIFPNLEYLYMSSNGLYGTIPTSVGSMSKLLVLDSSKNNFSSEIPKILWTGCSSLIKLKLSYNSLRGQLFLSPLNLSNLQYLSLSNNYFSGTLQHGMLPSLLGLDISNNKLWGTIPSFIGNLSHLKVIALSKNNFRGALPREFCKLDLLIVLLSHNKLSGSIPSCYLNFPYLSALHLKSKSLVGSIPKLRKSSGSLTSLDLRDNNLSGKIPDWVGNKVKFLRALLLGGNRLHGQLTNSLCQVNDCDILDLSRNKFTGSIPACLSNISFGSSNAGLYWDDILLLQEPYFCLHLKTSFSEYYDYLSTTFDAIEVEFRTKGSLLSYEGETGELMSGIDLSCNQLMGLIPQEIGYLVSLHAINLSHNYLNGSIPKSFHNLEDLESLDLSYNNLSGEIPPQLQELNFLQFFNVSYNNLSGTVPNKGQFGTFDESNFIGNPYLFSNNSNRGTTGQPSPTTGSNEGEEDDFVIDLTFFYWSFAASYVTVLLLFITILCINPHWRRTWFYFIETCLFKCFHRILGDTFF